MQKYKKFKKIIPGEKYGNYTAIRLVEITTKGGVKEKHWECSDIYGNFRTFRTNILRKQISEEDIQKMHDKNLEKLISENLHQIGIRRRIFREYVENSKKRGHLFELNFEEFNNLITKNCFYCDNSPIINKRWLKREHKYQPQLATNGIDRINSKEGYNSGNVVPCCSKCNLMKNVFETKDFLDHINKICDFNKKSSTTIL